MENFDRSNKTETGVDREANSPGKFSTKKKRKKEGKEKKICSRLQKKGKRGREKISAFVKDSLTRSLLASGIISRGAGLRISDNGGPSFSSSYGLDYATTLFLSFFRFLLSSSLSLFYYHCPGIFPPFPIPHPSPFLLSCSKSDDIWPTVISVQLRTIRGCPGISAFRTHGKTIRVQSGKDVRFIVDVILSFAFAVGRKR